MSGVTIGFNPAVPANADFVAQGAAVMRSIKTSILSAMDAEHTFNNAVSPSGVHRAGSARVFVGAASAISSSDTAGRLMWNSTSSQLHYVGSEGTGYIGGPRALSIATSTPSLGTGAQFVMSYQTFEQSTSLSAGFLNLGASFATRPMIMVTMDPNQGSANSGYATVYGLNQTSMRVALWHGDGIPWESGVTTTVIIQVTCLGIVTP